LVHLSRLTRTHPFSTQFGRTSSRRLMVGRKSNSCVTALRGSDKLDETQRCQLCHYNIVVAQLAALGFIKSV
jgi:hypothetical protein